MKLYVGNLSSQTSHNDLSVLFGGVGPVDSVVIMEDRETGYSRGFGFVEMNLEADGNAAIVRLNGKQLKGRALKIRSARPQNNGGSNRYVPRAEFGVGGYSAGNAYSRIC
jgi:cold-inducible RNA-binding protein